VLVGAGLLTREQRGIWAWFHLVPERFAELAEVFGDLARPAVPAAAGAPFGGGCG
jgi:hypothetical protein